MKATAIVRFANTCPTLRIFFYSFHFLFNCLFSSLYGRVISFNTFSLVLLHCPYPRFVSSTLLEYVGRLSRPNYRPAKKKLQPVFYRYGEDRVQNRQSDKLLCDHQVASHYLGECFGGQTCPRSFWIAT